MDSAITQLRGRCTIAWAWSMLGLPGRPTKHCRSPFRDDLRPSFSAYKAGDGERWYDYGEAIGGDVVDLWARAKGLSVKEALTDILRVVPGMEAPAIARQRRPNAQMASDGLAISGEPQEKECRALGALRGLSPVAFFLAGRLGTLKVATVYGQKSWIITDLNRRCAEARRFDGRPFMVDSKERKGFCLPGSKKDWPLGAKTLNPDFDLLKNIVLVEGQPDYYAALALTLNSSVNFRPVAMMGAGVGIGAGHLFRGAQVVIVPHNDIQGTHAGERWAQMAIKLGAAWVQIEPLPIEFNDLNEFLATNPPDPFRLFKEFNG